LDFKQEVFERYLIRSGKVGGTWQARAYRGKRAIGDPLIGATRDEAVAGAKARILERDAEISAERQPDGSPSAREYAEAFDEIGSLHPNYQAMLDAHLSAPDRLISSSQLAAAAGYANWSAANLHYGTLARRLAEAMNYNPPTRDDGSPIWTYTLATAAGDGDLEPEQLFAVLERSFDDPHFEWLLRPQVVEALRGR
jgi:hypothetical protein